MWYLFTHSECFYPCAFNSTWKLLVHVWYVLELLRSWTGRAQQNYKSCLPFLFSRHVHWNHILWNQLTTCCTFSFKKKYQRWQRDKESLWLSHRIQVQFPVPMWKGFTAACNSSSRGSDTLKMPVSLHCIYNRFSWIKKENKFCCVLVVKGYTNFSGKK